MSFTWNARKMKSNVSYKHDPIVRHYYCFDISGHLGQTWSARTFRDKISNKLYDTGYLKEGSKIGRCTAIYYLRQLGMVSVHPKKGIYKDGHERADTVAYRKTYTIVLNKFICLQVDLNHPNQLRPFNLPLWLIVGLGVMGWWRFVTTTLMNFYNGQEKHHSSISMLKNISQCRLKHLHNRSTTVVVL